MKRSWRFPVLWMCALLLSALPAQAADPIRIGVLAPLVGAAADDGLNVKNSCELAAEKINAAGGILGRKVELVVYDDRADPKEAIPLANRLIQKDRVAAVVGGSYSFPSRAVATVFQDEEIPFVAAYAVHPGITQAGSFCFRNGFLGIVEGRAIAKVLDRDLKVQRVALLYPDNDFGRTMAQGFREYMKLRPSSMTVVYETTFAGSEKDFRPLLTKMRARNPQAAVASGYYFQTGLLLDQARQMGLKTPFIGEQGSDSPLLLKIAGKSAEGFLMATNLDRDDPDPVAKEYLTAYRKRFGNDPNMCGGSAYDSMLLLAEAIRRSGSAEPAAICKALQGIQLRGVTGLIRFAPNREVIRPVQIQIVRDGKFRHYSVVKEMDLIRP